MQKLGRNWDAGGTPDKGRETLVECRRGPNRGRWEGGGRLEEGNTSMDMIYIHKPIKANCCVEHGKVGGRGVGTGGGINEHYVHICLYHPELQQDV